VAELVDAADSKSAVRKDVLVRFQSRALIQVQAILFRIAFLISGKARLLLIGSNKFIVF
jgi:hypothetical protein